MRDKSDVPDPDWMTLPDEDPKDEALPSWMTETARDTPSPAEEYADTVAGEPRTPSGASPSIGSVPHERDESSSVRTNNWPAWLGGDKQFSSDDGREALLDSETFDEISAGANNQ